jgi:fatty acid desaturase
MQQIPNDIPIEWRSTLVDDEGRSYKEFRAGLTPRYGRVWLHISTGYAALVAVLAGIALLDPDFPASVLAAAVGALLIGYTLAYLNNFFHEAAHYNLLPNRRANDRATNAALGWLYGSTIADYRRVHYQHHRALGTTQDSENSYFDALRVRYLLAGLFGVKVLRTLGRHRRVASGEASENGSGQARTSWWILLSGGVHIAIAGGLWLAGFPAASVAWLCGVVLVTPFFISLRQVLEHRSEEADAHLDYHEVDHGAVNRLFGDGPVANTLGSAGFNRHALHHWDPGISYTRLRDVERYLLRTPAAPEIQKRQTTYSETFLRLLEL